MNNYVDDIDDVPETTCRICFGPMEWVDCDQCFGEGGFHDCGEDCCMCADPDGPNEVCDVCKGQCGYLECASLPHTDEQMNAWRARKQEA